ncbi:MAG: TonB-dependent receptor [Chlorobi bacterium]|nr:TonB-dependent receptor [Chlorobiota bacterium]
MKNIYLKPGKFILFLVAFFLMNHIWAQEKTITGTVTSGDDGSTLPGVSIILKGTTMGTSTDMDGRYQIKVSPDVTTLVFSFVGMAQQEVSIEGRTIIDVVMQPNVKGLNEVVVIGYGQVKKSDATGAVTAISVKDFNQGSITSPEQLITGKTAGVNIVSNGGAPGEGSTIRIRGGSSLTAVNDPLIVIDGIPVANSDISGLRNPLNVVNPNDIETFTVLKDASATAIYGSRASNGVIIITTKKGKKGSGLKLSFDEKTSINTIAKTTEVLSTDEFKNIIQQRITDGLIADPNDTIAKILGNANTNWQDEIFNTSVGQEYNASATGSYKDLPYRASVGYSDQNGILKTDNMKRMTGAISLNPSLLDDHLNINVNLKGMNIKNKFANRDAIGSAVRFDPTQPVKDPNSPYGGYWTWLSSDGSGYPNGLAPSNPVAQLNLRSDESDVNRTIGNIQADYKLPFLPDLRANLNMGYDHSKSEGTFYDPATASWAFSTDSTVDGGTKRNYTQEKKNELLDFYLNYTKDADNIASKFDVMTGYSWQHFWRNNYTYETNDYTSDDRKLVVTDNEDATEYYLISFFGRFNYTLLNRYLLTFTLRNDLSSRFSPDTRSGIFPSVALAWKIKEESFLKNVDFVSNLKLRLGYGITGQQQINQGDYPYLAKFLYSQNDARYIFGNDTITTARPSAFDASLQWEETTTSNIGLDFGFAQDRIIGTIDMYKRVTTHLINEIPVPAGTNFSNRIVTNIGDLENKGIELSLTGRIIEQKDVFWELNYNISYNENKITKLTAVEDSNFLGVYTGGISGGVGNTIQIHSVGYPASSFFVYKQIYDQDGNPIEGLYEDLSGDGKITEDDRYQYKQPAPDIFMGFASRFQYKNFDFSFSGRISLGNYVYNNISSSQGVYQDMVHTTLYFQNLNRGVLESNFENFQYFSDYYIRNASFLRMDNITMGYKFEGLAMDKLDLRIFATVQNAFVITKYEGIDPEIGNGIDNNFYPRPRVFVIGLHVDF